MWSIGRGDSADLLAATESEEFREILNRVLLTVEGFAMRTHYTGGTMLEIIGSYMQSVDNP